VNKYLHTFASGWIFINIQTKDCERNLNWIRIKGEVLCIVLLSSWSIITIFQSRIIMRDGDTASLGGIRKKSRTLAENLEDNIQIGRWDNKIETVECYKEPVERFYGKGTKLDIPHKVWDLLTCLCIISFWMALLLGFSSLFEKPPLV